MGQAFEELLKLYPTFIDGYLEYWKYLKFRMGGFKGCKESLVLKMRDIAEQALYYSDCT